MAILDIFLLFIYRFVPLNQVINKEIIKIE